VRVLETDRGLTVAIQVLAADVGQFVEFDEATLPIRKPPGGQPRR
jgi:hypothetical protein